MIISIHIKNCSGTQVRQGLKDHFQAALFEDKGDETGSTWPSSLAKRERQQKNTQESKALFLDKFKAIHGHFNRRKYEILGNHCRYISFMRDPVSRVIANYDTLKNQPNSNQTEALIVNKLGFSLEEYIQHPDARNIQSRYLQSTTLKEYEFIGLTEKYEESIKKLNTQFDLSLSSTLPTEAEEHTSKEYEISNALAQLIKDCNPHDMELYALAIEKFNKA
ncbi:sulfotransferase family 2 domain-containing protein [Temperatibacter marinus]|uniref:Sulfotransferase family 2 domain-containing protein n=1 Tax=Temperatibacter marinus TaxID=1456591 RepID=A0AA52HAB2_9PROT|nr:sulfotransferase family 2 domain-containing protein [Temperatibacter marinus]WND04071.1 sulfotransferase family 2 domain-containing protein [Temperatibacter marinus]